MGVASRLTPARRMLFTAAIVCALLGIMSPGLLRFGAGALDINIGTASLWFIPSIGALLYLLIFELVDRTRVRDELEVARQLQRELMPQSAPKLAGYGFAHSYRTANEVGGDYYDFQPLPDGRLALAIGDASGHGIAAGLLMAIANATLKTALDVDPEPSKVADLMNKALFRTGDRRSFMTLFYSVLEPLSGRLDYVCAGHPFPLLRGADGAIRELGRGALPLGMKESLDLEVQTVSLEEGDLLALFSDGLPEAIAGRDEEAFGFERLKDLLAPGGTAAALHNRILDAFDRHMGDDTLTDDLTLVVLARHAVPPPPAPVA